MIAAVGAASVVVMIAYVVRPRPLARRPPTRTVRPERARRRLAVFRRRPRSPGDIEAADVAVWCEAMARVVRGGSTLTAALRDVDPPISFEPAIAPITLALARGSSLSTAIDVRTSSSHLSLALGVLHACTMNGGPPAEPLDRAAATLRARAVAKAERQTQSAQARLSVVVMTVLPIAMLTLLLLTSAATRAATATPIGLVVLATGGALNAIGWRWMRQIIAGRSA